MAAADADHAWTHAQVGLPDGFLKREKPYGVTATDVPLSLHMLDPFGYDVQISGFANNALTDG
jgi:hypothetical protein